MKKYKILYDSELIIHKHVLHRIEACCTFRTFQGSLVREGEVGDVFIADSAEICGGAK